MDIITYEATTTPPIGKLILVHPNLHNAGAKQQQAEVFYLVIFISMGSQAVFCFVGPQCHHCLQMLLGFQKFGCKSMMCTFCGVVQHF